jgi:hypothetical protein
MLLVAQHVLTHHEMTHITTLDSKDKRKVSMSGRYTQNTDAQKIRQEVILSIDQVLLDMQEYYMWRLESPDPIQLLNELAQSKQSPIVGELSELIKEQLTDDTGASMEEIAENKKTETDLRYIERVEEIQGIRRLFVDATSLNAVPMNVIKQLETILNMMIVWGVQRACCCEAENEMPELEKRLPGFKKYLYAILAISPPSERDPFYPMDF